MLCINIYACGQRDILLFVGDPTQLTQSLRFILPVLIYISIRQIRNISITDSLYPYDSKSVSAPEVTEHRVYYYHADSLYKETIYDPVTS